MPDRPLHHPPVFPSDDPTRQQASNRRGTSLEGKPFEHPPVPGDSYHPTSMRPHRRFSTGDQPGPGSEGPLDPRVHYPRLLNEPRPSGQGCSTCKWNAVCAVLYYNRNFGWIENEHMGGGQLQLDPNIGRSCESWNVDFPPPDPSIYDDGLGLGDPFSDDTLPDDALDPSRYTGQWGDLRLAEPAQKDSRTS